MSYFFGSHFCNTFFTNFFSQLKINGPPTLSKSTLSATLPRWSGASVNSAAASITSCTTDIWPVASVREPGAFRSISLEVDSASIRCSASYFPAPISPNRIQKVFVAHAEPLRHSHATLARGDPREKGGFPCRRCGSCKIRMRKLRKMGPISHM